MKTEIAELKPAIEFFRDNAGYCIPPGRMACALSLARAERDADLAGFEVQWFDDEDGCTGCDACTHKEQYNSEVLCAVLRNSKGHVLASLGSICGRPHVTREYKRVVAAQLALEAF
jgi:hypothetical protein